MEQPPQCLGLRFLIPLQGPTASFPQAKHPSPDGFSAVHLGRAKQLWRPSDSATRGRRTAWPGSRSETFENINAWFNPPRG